MEPLSWVFSGERGVKRKKERHMKNTSHKIKQSKIKLIKLMKNDISLTMESNLYALSTQYDYSGGRGRRVGVRVGSEV